jgi:iron complex outermembrane receptor protein
LSPQKNLNLNLNWFDVMGKPFDFSLFATNVTNAKFIEATDGTGGSQGGFGFDVAYLDPPRMFGARVRYHFGH